MIEWFATLSIWAKTTLEQAGSNPSAIPFAFVLGLASAVTATCCTLPLFGAIIGFAGTRPATDRRSYLLDALFFMLGIILALLILGGVAALLGQVAQSVMGQYWKLFAGTVSIIVGLHALNMLPIKMPDLGRMKSRLVGQGFITTMFVGLTIGGAVSICSLGCNPGIFIILGVAVLQGYTFWMLAVLLAYAIGFSLPLTALLLGVSLGKFALKLKSAEKALRYIAGAVMIGVGYYFFWTY